MSTTIRVSDALHDRLAQEAADAGTTLAAVIERALEAEERSRFWQDVRTTMTSPSADPLAHEATGASIRDGLDPDETWTDIAWDEPDEAQHT